MLAYVNAGRHLMLLVCQDWPVRMKGNEQVGAGAQSRRPLPGVWLGDAVEVALLHADDELLPFCRRI